MQYKTAWIVFKDRRESLRITGVIMLIPEDGKAHACLRGEDKQGLPQTINLAGLGKEFTINYRKDKEGNII